MDIQEDSINFEIMENELAATDWELWELANEINWWIHFFQAAFFKQERVPMPVISFQKERITTLGSYRLGRNSIGVKQNINLNRAHLSRPLWETLQTLCHELVHVWEHTYLDKLDRTINWFHKKAFREKLAGIGILANEKGQHISVTDPFVHLLRQHGIVFGDNDRNAAVIEVPKRQLPKNTSKLKKYSCACTNVRVAVPNFFAVCLTCGAFFKKRE